MDIPFYFYLNAVAIFLWLFFRKRFKAKLDVLGYYLIFCFASESLAWLYSFFSYRSNHWIYNIYTTLQILFLSYLYLGISTHHRIRTLIKSFVVLYPVAVVLNLVFLQEFLKFHTYSYVLGCVFVIFLVFAYFNQLLQSSEIHSLRRNPYFWFNLGNMIYFIGSIFYMGSINFILETGHDQYGELIQIFVYSFTSVQFLCFAGAIVCNLRPVSL